MVRVRRGISFSGFRSCIPKYHQHAHMQIAHSIAAQSHVKIMSFYLGSPDFVVLSPPVKWELVIGFCSSWITQLKL